MKNLLIILVCIVFAAFLSTTAVAQETFQRAAVIDADTLDVGGYGHTVSGLDIDGDGKLEIYAVNTDWHDVAGYDLVPRIYKYEQVTAGDPTAWTTVWSTRLSMDYQNTWAPLDYGDLDGDGRGEIIWGPVNNTAGGLNPNPDRIVVFETPGDGSDNMGVDNGDGTWRPNARWDITQTPNDNLRPFKWIVTDIDNDGAQEIVSCIRAGTPGMQIYSVNDVPDAADSTETWTIEFTGLSGTHYDIAVIGNMAYGISSGGDVTPVEATGPDTYVEGTTQAGVVPNGSWKSASTVDVDGNQQHEIIVASWSSSTSAVYLLQQSGDTLTTTMVKDVPDASNRLYGGAAGDLDDDGNVDFVFGTREATPNGLVQRLEYQGGDMTDPNNWALSDIDSLISTTATQYDIVNVANLDGDADDEVIYTGTPRGNSATDIPQPIVILDRVSTGIEDGFATVPNGFALDQNYPNPFNPETEISYTIPRALTVSLKIYNMLGQEIKTLVNENRSAGTHTVRWNGLNNQGVKVSSGIYIYTIRAGEFLQSKKMTFMK